MYFKKDANTYCENFLQNVVNPSSIDISKYFSLGSAEELKELLYYEWNEEKLQKLQEDLAKITAILVVIEGLLTLFKDVLIPAFQTIRITAAAGLFLLKGPAADGDATIKLADTMKKSQSQKESMENSIKVFSRKVEKIRKKVAIPLGILTLALGVILTIKLTLIYQIITFLGYLHRKLYSF